MTRYTRRRPAVFPLLLVILLALGSCAWAHLARVEARERQIDALVAEAAEAQAIAAEASAAADIHADEAEGLRRVLERAERDLAAAETSIALLTAERDAARKEAARAKAAMPRAIPQSSRGTTPRVRAVAASGHLASVERWRPLVARYFRAEHVNAALCVMYKESRGNPRAKNRSSGASGLFQHLPRYWPARAAQVGFTGASIFDPTANVAAAARLAQGGRTWRHWTAKPCGACR